MSKFWLIRGYDSNNTLFKYKIPYKSLPRTNKIKTIIKLLTAKSSLSDEEIINSSSNKLLKVNFDIKHFRNRHIHFCSDIVLTTGISI